MYITTDLKFKIRVESGGGVHIVLDEQIYTSLNGGTLSTLSVEEDEPSGCSFI